MPTEELLLMATLELLGATLLLLATLELLTVLELLLCVVLEEDISAMEELLSTFTLDDEGTAELLLPAEDEETTAPVLEEEISAMEELELSSPADELEYPGGGGGGSKLVVQEESSEATHTRLVASREWLVVILAIIVCSPVLKSC